MTPTLGVALVCIALLNSDERAKDGPDPYELERARAAVVRAAVESVAPSIVMIETIGGAQPVVEGGPGRILEESFRLADGPSTGLIWSSDGYILSSSFNFARDPSIITVTLHDGRRMVAKLLGRDHIRRIALLKVDADGLKPAEWSGRAELRVGQYGIACGRALGGERPSISLGIISALGRRNGNAVQTDAKISPMNYGGPLLDIDGRVIGLIVPMAGLGGALAGAEWNDSGIGFAILRDRIEFVFDRLAAGESIEPGKIGVALEEDEPSLFPFLDNLLPQSKGVRIKEVARRSPASRAKLKAGDKIVALDGQPTGDMPELQRRLSDRAAGESVRLTIKRRWRSMDVKLTLARASDIGKPLKAESTEARESSTGDDTTTQPVAD
ncbi:MAG: trypsin-like peptidase domain-containing protein [Phycisphaerae bacterium]|nr:trypsin-like peptidase domain-containing protein [Phycisphaerae bacterium]